MQICISHSKTSLNLNKECANLLRKQRTIIFRKYNQLQFMWKNGRCGIGIKRECTYMNAQDIFKK